MCVGSPAVACVAARPGWVCAAVAPWVPVVRERARLFATSAHALVRKLDRLSHALTHNFAAIAILHGPCRCPSGTGLSSGIMPATPAAASATRAAGNHHAQLV